MIFQAHVAKSLPSLSSYLNHKGRSAVIHIEQKVEGSEPNGNDQQKNRQSSEENVIMSNGSRTNAFKSATQKYAMHPSNSKVSHYLMGIGPNTKKSPRIAESRFGYLKVCSSIV